ncbi:hypothetical protein DL766_002677 [Monosporascus sp. MC13-8B]|uniref:Uncharacterized protein n=1 Tax=Monosporascus cannonballus TaxID=155416 RepID=A0ABY0H2P7_9PEZI|nr:hypothetical protein DL762_007469 [Monosporascus cannonballus]RYO83826.1 hypothetical protein DL763_007705 [Monosporascus cannonballus]RYP35113.1 hypothetical protein DL766_002677 [Monosporascus sp. MC13-8B]
MATVQTRRRVGGPRKPASPTGQLKRVPNRAEAKAILEAKAAREKRKRAQRERSTTSRNFQPRGGENDASRVGPDGAEEPPPVDDVVLVLRGVGALDRVQLARSVLGEIRRAAQYSARHDGGGRVCRLYTNPEGTALLESVAYPRGVTAGRPELAVRSAGVLIPGRPGRPVYEGPATTAYLWEDSGEESGEVRHAGFVDPTPGHVLDTPEGDGEEEYPRPGFGPVPGSGANKTNGGEGEEGVGEKLVEVDGGNSGDDLEWLMTRKKPAGEQQQQQRMTTKKGRSAKAQVQSKPEEEGEGEEPVGVGSGAPDGDLEWLMTMKKPTGEQQQATTTTTSGYERVQIDPESEGEREEEQPGSPTPTPSKKPPPPVRTDYRDERPGPSGPAVAAPHTPINVTANAHLQSAGLAPVRIDNSEARGVRGLLDDAVEHGEH